MLRKYHKKPMSIKRINMLMKDVGSEYHLEKEDNGEIVMVKNGEE